MSIQAERTWLMIAIDLAKMQRDLQQKTAPAGVNFHQTNQYFAPNSVGRELH